MNKMWAVLAGILTVAGLAGCGGSSGGDDATAQQVAAYRAAIPDAQELLVASAPRSTLGRVAAAAGDPALYPPLAMAVVPQINGIVTGLIETLQTIVNSPYTLFSPQDQMVLWGPFPNDDGAGQVVVVITKEVPTEDDPFEYIYVFLRVDDDFRFTDLDTLASEQIVLFGGAAPDGAEGPIGLAVFDFDANAAFAQAQGESGPFTTGGFATAFGKMGPDAELAGVLSLVIAAFRDFVPEDEPGKAPVDVDYLYGRYVPSAAGQPEVDFLEFKAEVDVEETSSTEEKLDIRMAFINQSEGRAEVSAAGGDLEEGISADAVECWNVALQREYLSYQQSNWDLPYTEGALAGCGFTFSQTLDELQIPSLQSLTADDPELMRILERLAEMGWAGIEEE